MAASVLGLLHTKRLWGSTSNQGFCQEWPRLVLNWHKALVHLYLRSDSPSAESLCFGESAPFPAIWSSRYSEPKDAPTGPADSCAFHPDACFDFEQAQKKNFPVIVMTSCLLPRPLVQASGTRWLRSWWSLFLNSFIRSAKASGICIKELEILNQEKVGSSHV